MHKKYAPKLILTPSAEQLASQMEAWRVVICLSDSISEDVISGNWEKVLLKAEDRDLKIQQFFDQDVCQAIFLQVETDLVSIKNQHKEILAHLKQRELEIDQEEHVLINLRQQIDQLVTKQN